MAFDVRTGKKKWVFHTIPRKGEFGYDTWLSGSAEYTRQCGSLGAVLRRHRTGIRLSQCGVRDQ